MGIIKIKNVSRKPSIILLRVVVLFLMIFLLPVYTILSLLILVVDGWPFIFVQKRVGLNGKNFKLYKFRTMYKGADKDKERYRKLNEASGPVFKINKDPRFHRLGAFLSHSGMDELPQFWNIVRGEMSIIGPRPLPIDESKRISKKYKIRESILPGIVSPWIFNGYHKMSFEDWMRSDMEYVKNKSFIGDLKLVFMATALLIGLILRESFDILTRFLKSGLLFHK